MDSIRLGSRVYYKDNGLTDMGTVIDFVMDDRGPILVKWDLQRKSEYKTKTVDELLLLGIEPFDISYNPADENIDGFKPSQLVLVQY